LRVQAARCRPYRDMLAQAVAPIDALFSAGPPA